MSTFDNTTTVVFWVFRSKEEEGRVEKKLETEGGRVKNLFPEKTVREILHCVQE
jgi:hypothetical protein